MGENLVKNIQAEDENNQIRSQRLYLQWSDIKYTFSKRSLVFSYFNMLILGILIYLFLNMRFNSWVTATFIKQVSYLLDLIFNIEANMVVDPNLISIFLPNSSHSNRVMTVCYGAEVISIFVGIILATPSSHNNKPNINLIWRKTKIIIITIISTYLLYLIRMVLMLAFVQNGIPMHIIHDSSYYLITLISFTLILYSLRRFLPEFIISLHFIGYFILNKEVIIPAAEKINKKKNSNFIFDLTVEKKELYYPLLGITVCTSLLYIICLFLSVYGSEIFYINVNPIKMSLPFLLALVILVSRYLFDMIKLSLKINLTISILSLVLIVCLFFFISIIGYLLVSEVLFTITAVIYVTSVIFIYWFFHREVKDYLLIQRV